MIQNLIQLFEATALAYPENTALADSDHSFTFAHLRDCAQRLGCLLLERDLGGKIIAVVARRDVWTPALFLGILYAGSAYVPLDEEMPEEKRQKILLGSGAAAVLCHGEPFPGGLSVTEDLLQEVCIREAALDEVREKTAPDAMAYLVYTSGSTGVPKGVAKSHGSILSYTEAFTSLYPFAANTVLGNQTPFFFDASAKDLYLMAATGASIQIIPRELFSFPVKLMQWMDERKIDTISWVPSALSIVTQLNTFLEIKPQCLRRVFFVGEVFPMKQLNKWRAALPHIDYVNLYGSSEIAGVACFFPVEGEFADSDSLPIGKSLPNCTVRLVDKGQVITCADKVGEIYIVSPALALGYFGDEEKTAASFRELDLGDGVIRRYFATGDMARYDSQGRLVFAARRDFQIKHMGHRIELGEIETAAGALEDMQKCCCLYHKEKQKIILFCQLTPGSALTGRDIRKLLRQRLSDYMVPARVQVMDELPLNPNGKIDRVRLQEFM